MCQLLAVNSVRASDITDSFRSFTKNGGKDNPHGWGMSYYDHVDDNVKTVVQPLDVNCCPVANQLSVTTNNMIAHVRFATQGGVCVSNAHPFRRELWGVQLCFAHNGEIPRYYRSQESGMFDNECFRPMGTTDSEAFFCEMVNYLLEQHGQRPSNLDLHQTVHEFCTRIASEHDYLILNFVLSIGNTAVLAYSWPGRRPGGKVWNGLHYLRRRCNATGSSSVVVATKPLDCSSDWVELQRNELILVQDGRVHTSLRTSNQPCSCAISFSVPLAMAVDQILNSTGSAAAAAAAVGHSSVASTAMSPSPLSAMGALPALGK